MALVTLETTRGEEVHLNPDHVQVVSTHQSFDQDKKLPDDFYEEDGDGLLQVKADKKEEADAMRVSERVLVLMTSGVSFEVKGTRKEVLAALAPSETPKKK